MARAKWWWVLPSFYAVVLTGGWTAVGTAVALVALHGSSLRVVATWESPPETTYRGRGPYFLSVVETDTDFRGFPMHTEPNFVVYVGRERGTPTYGHMVKYSFNPSQGDEWNDTDLVIRRCHVVWSTDGVTLEEGSGHRLFIPASVIGGGR